MYVLDHKPALVMAITSMASYVVHTSTGAPVIETVANVPVVVVAPVFDVVERWVHLIGGIGAALAGFASAAWYGYSFIKARRSGSQ